LEVKSWKQQKEEGLKVLLHAKQNCVCVVPLHCSRTLVQSGVLAEAKEIGDGPPDTGKDAVHAAINAGYVDYMCHVYELLAPPEECEGMIERTVLENVGGTTVTVGVLRVFFISQFVYGADRHENCACTTTSHC
jgi:hypothetical protein